MTSPFSAPSLDLDLAPGDHPVLTVPAGDDPLTWLTAHRSDLRRVVSDRGWVMVRGARVRDAADAAAAVDAVTDDLMSEREAFAPRQEHRPRLYASTKWPPQQPMCMHNELSYLLEFPGVLVFACLTAAEQGGVTAVADTPTVLADLPADLVDRFERHGWLLARSYNDEIGASWSEAFGTADRAEVEHYCRAQGIAYEWQGDGGLRTRQRRSAILRHPVTGQRCWFNQIAFLNEWTIDLEIREYLVEMYGSDGLPFTTRFGDGDPIGPDIVDLLNEVYETHTVREPWADGDLMLVDNIRTAHSREAYRGKREVLVALADPVHLSACSPTVEVASA